MEFYVGKFVCSRAAYCSGLSDMYAGKNIKLRQYVHLCRRFPRPRDSLFMLPTKYNIRGLLLHARHSSGQLVDTPTPPAGINNAVDF